MAMLAVEREHVDVEEDDAHQQDPDEHDPAAPAQQASSTRPRGSRARATERGPAGSAGRPSRLSAAPASRGPASARTLARLRTAPPGRRRLRRRGAAGLAAADAERAHAADRRAARARWRGGGCGRCGARHQSCHLELARRAQLAGLGARVVGNLAGRGRRRARVSSSASGLRPQTQTGRSGGQMQPRARSARKRFTRRSSSEWKRDGGQAARRAQEVPGQRQRCVERAELVVHGDADRLEDALGRVAAAELRCRAPARRPRSRRPARRSSRAGPRARRRTISRGDLARRSAPRRSSWKSVREPALVPLVHYLARVEILRPGPSACRAGRRRSRRSRAPMRPPASTRRRGPDRPGPPERPPRAAAAGPRSSPCAGSASRRAPRARTRRSGPPPAGSRSMQTSVPRGPDALRHQARVAAARRRCSPRRPRPGAGRAMSISSPASTGT